MKKSFYAFLLAALCALPAQAADIKVLGLFKNAALISVDGRQQLLRAGQSDRSGIKLLAADPRRAVLLVEGRRLELGLSEQVAGNYKEADQAEVSIPRNRNLEYQTTISINGRSTVALVDTGANFVAMSASHAGALGVDYRDGQPTQVNTAGGMAAGYVVTLGSVSVGGITAHSVPAVVIEGAFPHKPLLGMTFLDHVDMQEKDNILILRQRY